MMKLGIVCPCYNEHEVLLQSGERLTALLDGLVAKQKIAPDSFVLLVNDGSRDNTWQLIKQLHDTNHYFKGVNLAKNVFHERERAADSGFGYSVGALPAFLAVVSQLAGGAVSLDV